MRTEKEIEDDIIANKKLIANPNAYPDGKRAAGSRICGLEWVLGREVLILSDKER